MSQPQCFECYSSVDYPDFYSSGVRRYDQHLNYIKHFTVLVLGPSWQLLVSWLFVLLLPCSLLHVSFWSRTLLVFEQATSLFLKHLLHAVTTRPHTLATSLFFGTPRELGASVCRRLLVIAWDPCSTTNQSSSTSCHYIDLESFWSCLSWSSWQVVVCSWLGTEEP